MFALLIPGNFPVRDKNRFFKVCEGNGTDAVKFACVTEDVALAALLHGGLLITASLTSGVVQPLLLVTPLVPKKPLVKWYS